MAGPQDRGLPWDRAPHQGDLEGGVRVAPGKSTNVEDPALEMYGPPLPHLHRVPNELGRIATAASLGTLLKQGWAHIG